jgi:hypothetical protein
MQKQRRVLQIRLSERDEAMIERLIEDYGLDRTALVLRALEYVDTHKPVFQIVPAGKGLALTTMAMN